MAATESSLLEPDHYKRLQAVKVHFIGSGGNPNDPEWNALLIVLTVTPSLWAKVEPYVDLHRHRFTADELRQQVDLTGGERLLLDLAENLFNGNTLVDVGRMAGTLDDRHWGAALEAILARRGF